MNIVDVNERTTLLLSYVYQPLSIITARAAIHHHIAKRIKGVDKDFNTFEFMGNCNPYPNNPVIRSAHEVHIVPTIAICTSKFIVKRKRKFDRFLSVREIYRLYRGVCQYCLRKIDIKEATRDHHYPKSKGGSNHDFNLVLSCKKCNSIKDSLFPYKNINGEDVVPKVLTGHHHIMMIDDHEIREEWKPLLYK